MAREIQEIKREITDDFVTNGDIIDAYGLAPVEENKTFNDQFSHVSVESIWFYLHADKIWLLETLFDQYREEVNEIVRTQRNHTVGWYRQTALNFQFGRELREDIAEYDNTGLSPEDIAAERIITKAAVEVMEFAEKPTLQIKVAKSDTWLNSDELAAFTAYMNEKADAGVRTSIITGEPDRLWLSIIIRHDGLVFNNNGERLFGAGVTVPDAIVAHLNNLVFNGSFFPSLLEQELMRLPGVKVATVQVAQAAPAGGTLTQFIDKYKPFTGALKIDIDNDLLVEYEII
ncbi:MAG: hypothetical protein FWC39_07960 [Bacteroidetes bacterium]|nr:hypothetical protein [Bacteroidota bacterium]